MLDPHQSLFTQAKIIEYDGGDDVFLMVELVRLNQENTIEDEALAR